MRICTIEARMSSSRLPGKVLMKHRGLSMLEFMVRRLETIPDLGAIVVATTINSIDSEIVEECQRLGINYYRGSENDVLSRVLEAADSMGASEIVALTGDCPLIDPEIVENCIQTFEANDCDYLSNAGVRSYPDGMDTQVLRLETLKKSNEFSLSNDEREHVTLHIRRNPQLFRLIYLTAPREYRFPELGLTLDEYEDFEFISKVIDEFYPRIDFSLRDILEVLKSKKNLLNINKKIIRKSVT